MSEADKNNEVNDDQPIQPTADPPTSSYPMAFEAEWHGPLPPPFALSQYDQIVPGSAERLLVMAERGHQHRMDQETGLLELEKETLQSVNAVIANDAAHSRWGLGLGFVVAMVGIGMGGWLISASHGGFGLAFLFVPLSSLVGSFVYATRALRSRPRVVSDGRQNSD